MARRISGVGRVTVSLRRSITPGSELEAMSAKQRVKRILQQKPKSRHVRTTEARRYEGKDLAPCLRGSVLDSNLVTEEATEHFVREQASTRRQQDSISVLQQ